MNSLRRFFGFIFVVVLLASCSTSSNTVYSYSPPTTPDGQVCVDECKQSNRICKDQCTVASPECLAKEQEKAQHEFGSYVEAQEAAGQPVSQPMLSFYHPENCNHSGCGCEKNYTVCYQLCGTRTEIHDALVVQ